MLTNTLEFINVFLLFKLLLKYPFRKNKVSISIGIALILFQYAMPFLFSEDVYFDLYLIWTAIPVIIIPFLFQGKVWNSLGAGLCLRAIMPLMESLTMGIYFIICKPGIEEMHLDLSYQISQGICIAVTGILSALFWAKRERIHAAVEKINIGVFVAFAICMQILNLDAGYSGDLPEEQVQIIHGINLSKSGMLAVFAVTTFVLILVLMQQKRDLKRTLVLNERCIQEQTEQYRLLSQGDKQLRKFRHDYNEHVAVLHALAQNEEKEALSTYIKQLAAIKDEAKLIFTNDIICDAIMNRYYHICQEEDISLLVNGKFPDRVSIPETALCVLISNGIKNAYEAVVNGSGHQEIQFDVQNTEHLLFITIENPIHEPLKIEKGIPVTTKQDKNNHGYGTVNMLETARKIGGDVSWKISDNGHMITEITIDKSVG